MPDGYAMPFAPFDRALFLLENYTSGPYACRRVLWSFPGRIDVIIRTVSLTPGGRAFPLLEKYAEVQKRFEELGFASGRWTDLVVAGEAMQRGVSVHRKPDKRTVYLSYQGKTRWWRGGASDINTTMAKRIARHKDVSSRLLRNAGISAPENAVFSNDQAHRAWRWAQDFGRIVVKPHNGLQGRDVFVAIETEDEFHEAFSRVGRDDKPVLVEEHRPGVEYRCLVVKNEFVAATRRRPASVEGDGASSVQRLVELKNADRGPIHKKLQLGRVEVAQLAKQGLEPASVPAAGQRVYLRATSNLHTGGDALDATQDISLVERAVVEAAARAVPGLTVAGFDVLISRESAEHPEVTILEINANPMVSMHHFPWEGEPRDVASPIVETLFPSLAGARS